MQAISFHGYAFCDGADGFYVGLDKNKSVVLFFMWVWTRTRMEQVLCRSGQEQQWSFFLCGSGQEQEWRGCCGSGQEQEWRGCCGSGQEQEWRGCCGSGQEQEWRGLCGSGQGPNSKHWFTTSFFEPLPYLVTP